MGQTCLLQSIIGPVQGKWKAEILFYLKDGSMRFGDLEHSIPSANPRVLKRQLRSLETDGVPERHVFDGVPPRVEYSLTEYGTALIALLDSFNRETIEYMRRFNKTEP